MRAESLGSCSLCAMDSMTPSNMAVAWFQRVAREPRIESSSWSQEPVTTLQELLSLGKIAVRFVRTRSVFHLSGALVCVQLLYSQIRNTLLFYPLLIIIYNF